MSLSNVSHSEAKQRLLDEATSKTQHLDRFNRCREKYDRLSRDEVVRWLNELQPQEREFCRNVLNGLRNRRKPDRTMKYKEKTKHV